MSDRESQHRGDGEDSPKRRRRPNRRPPTKRPADEEAAERTRPMPGDGNPPKRRPKRRPVEQGEGGEAPRRRRSSQEGEKSSRSRPRPEGSERSRPKPEQQRRRSSQSRDRAEASGAPAAAASSRKPRSKGKSRSSRSQDDQANRSAANQSGTQGNRRAAGTRKGGRRGAKKGGTNKTLVIGIVGFILIAGGALAAVAVWRHLNPPPPIEENVEDKVPGEKVPTDSFMMSTYMIGDKSASDYLKDLNGEDETAIAAARDAFAAEIEKEVRLAEYVSEYLYAGINEDNRADRLKSLTTVMNSAPKARTRADHISRFFFEIEGEEVMDDATQSALAALVPKIDTESSTYLGIINDGSAEHKLKLLVVDYLVKNKGSDQAVIKYFKGYADIVNKQAEDERDPKAVELINMMNTVITAPTPGVPTPGVGM